LCDLRSLKEGNFKIKKGKKKTKYTHDWLNFEWISRYLVVIQLMPEYILDFLKWLIICVIYNCVIN